MLGSKIVDEKKISQFIVINEKVIMMPNQNALDSVVKKQTITIDQLKVLSDQSTKELQDKFNDQIKFEKFKDSNNYDFLQLKEKINTENLKEIFNTTFNKWDTPQAAFNSANNILLAAQVFKMAFDTANALNQQRIENNMIAKIKEENRLKIKEFVIERQKSTGMYLSKEAAQRFDTILTSNGIKVTNDGRDRLQRQLAIDLISILMFLRSWRNIAAKTLMRTQILLKI